MSTSQASTSCGQKMFRAISPSGEVSGALDEREDEQDEGGAEEDATGESDVRIGSRDSGSASAEDGEHVDISLKLRAMMDRRRFHLLHVPTCLAFGTENRLEGIVLRVWVPL